MTSIGKQLVNASLLLFTIAAVAQNPVVKTGKGYIKGLTENGIAVFKGIPYAQPPIDSLRYRPPVAPQPWTDTLKAIQFGPSAPQPSNTTTSENCLFLNVFTPNPDNHKRAVTVWIHGGSMTAGNGKSMDGHAFADKDDIVTITIEYRLGILGFLYLGDLDKKYSQSGNLGLLDVIAALQWVQENIAAFGGDPTRVTVMGESAGAKLLSALMVSPASKGLYSQAILESGSVQCIRDTVTAKNARALLLKQLGLGEDQTRQLLTLPADTLIKAQAKVCAGIGGNSFFGPVWDGVTITENAYTYASEGNIRDIKIIIGTNENEGAAFTSKNDRFGEANTTIFKPLFRSNAPMANAYYQRQLKTDTPYAAMVKTLTQYMYQIHSYRFAKALTGSTGGTASGDNATVWMYRYNYQNGQPFGARHGDELRYIWGAAAILHSTADTTKKQLAKSLHDAWAAFIKTGDPNNAGLPNWPSYSDGNRQVMYFGDNNTVVQLEEVYDDKDFPPAVFVIHQ